MLGKLAVVAVNVAFMRLHYDLLCRLARMLWRDQRAYQRETNHALDLWLRRSKHSIEAAFRGRQA